jgi:uncharacterized protein (DUF427 family)
VGARYRSQWIVFSLGLPASAPCRADHPQIHVSFNGDSIADTRHAIRFLETAGAPVYSIPPQVVRRDFLTPTRRRTHCEWKGDAAYSTLTVGDRSILNAAWTYPAPTPPFAAIAGYLAFYPHDMGACLVDGVPAQPQTGAFYGGWITPDVVSPFKGEPGSEHRKTVAPTPLYRDRGSDRGPSEVNRNVVHPAGHGFRVLSFVEPCGRIASCLA